MHSRREFFGTKSTRGLQLDWDGGIVAWIGGPLTPELSALPARKHRGEPSTRASGYCRHAVSLDCSVRHHRSSILHRKRPGA
jgi:hypothetical protein